MKMKCVVEPLRKSLLDVVRKNLRAAGLVTYVTRVVYFGEYSGTPEDFQKKMATNIEDLQSDYTDIRITGLLLVYPKYYIHILEAPDDIIYKYFNIVYNDKNESFKFGKGIILSFYHHVHQRFFVEWFYAYTIPPTLLDKLEANNLNDIQRQMSNCLVKVYALCDNIETKIRDRSFTTTDIVQYLKDRATHLPESTLLQFLLNVKLPIFQTIKDYVKTHSKIPQVHLYNDNSWPPPRNFMF